MESEDDEIAVPLASYCSVVTPWFGCLSRLVCDQSTAEIVGICG